MPRVAASASVLVAIAVAAVVAPAAAKGPKYRPAKSDVSSFADKLIVLFDGKKTYLMVEKFGPSDHVFYGDGKTFYRQRGISSSSDTGADQYNVTFWSPQAGRDASIDLEGGRWWLTCGETRETTFTVVGEKARKRIMRKAKFYEPKWPRRAHALLRDDDGVYFYVDRLRDDYGGQGFRLFVGRKGRMVEQSLVDSVSDGGGDVFVTKKASLRLTPEPKNRNRNWTSASWGKGKDRVDLQILPILANRHLIYAELGIYTEPLGTPCDVL